jgi:CRISPR-associated endonuclease/helicase Cas3
LTYLLCSNGKAMDWKEVHFWAKTTKDGQPGISVRDHCLNVGCVAETLIAALLPAVRALLPPGAATLTALHDVGKITIGFLAKCPLWLVRDGSPKVSPAEVALSVTDHALVSQVFLQKKNHSTPAGLWAVAVGAHHGRPKGKNAQLNAPEALAEWAEANRLQVMAELLSVFGPLPTTAPEPRLAPHHSGLWLLAGLISVADWIGSNETWFSPEHGLQPEAARQQARDALREIGWPGGRLRRTAFSVAFAAGQEFAFQPNSLQQAVADAAHVPGILIVEGPMGCGKTEAALFAAQQFIASEQQQGIYFALPTQVTSNRIHRRIERFLRNTLADGAPLRLAHGNAWLEDNFDLRLRPSFQRREKKDGDDPDETIQQARSWFASSKQALLAPYGVGTIDQALQGVVAVKHFFVRRFALAGKVVILDEVHSYDIYTGTLITALIRELVNLRCSVIILSATLTADRRRELLAAAGITEPDAPADYPLLTTGASGTECRHVSPEWSAHRRINLRPAVVSEEETAAELITRAEAGQRVLWIRNTVIEAQDAFRATSGSIREGSIRVGLLHSRFPFQRRMELEDDWLERLGKTRPANGPGSILIATQVVEQSVDIDLDFIVSDLAPTDMLLQRLGRLWRHERLHRHASEPAFWIRLPELSAATDAAELKKALVRSARVYAPYVLLRSMKVWEGRSEINLPVEIRPLLEATYAQPDAQEPEVWRELHAELEREKATLAGNAEAATRVLANPMLTDKEEVLTRRKGAPTKLVVLLLSITTGRHGLTTLVALDGSQAEVSEHEWRRASARFLHHWFVRAPRWLVPANAPKPRWLALNGRDDATVALVGDDGRCVFDEGVSPMTYDPRLGIFAENQAKPTSQWKDDEDEFDY